MNGYSAYQSAPVTQQAVVTVNAGFDRFFCLHRKAETDASKLDDRYMSTDDHCFTVQQRELVFRLNPVYNDVISRPDRYNGVNDMALKVFSSANRFPSHLAFKSRMGGGPLSSAGRDAVLRSAVSFVGVAQQPVDFMNTNQKDNVAVQVGGSCTIWNTGTRPIRPGQKIVWTFPAGTEQVGAGRKRKHIAGEPVDKHLFAVQPLEAEFSDGKSMAAHDFVSALFSIHDPFSAAPETEEGKALKKVTDGALTRDKLIDYTRKAIVLYEEVRSRVIGIALSGANPGQQFDIMLCSSH